MTKKKKQPEISTGNLENAYTATINLENAYTATISVSRYTEEDFKRSPAVALVEVSSWMKTDITDSYEQDKAVSTPDAEKKRCQWCGKAVIDKHYACSDEASITADLQTRYGFAQTRLGTAPKHFDREWHDGSNEW